MPAELIVQPQTLWKLGNYEAVNAPPPILLTGNINNGAGESRYGGLFVPGAATSYQVPANKTLYLTHVTFRANIANCDWATHSATEAILADQIAAPAGLTAQDTVAQGASNPLTALSANVIYQVPIIIIIAASRYPLIRGFDPSGIITCNFLGHLEPA